MQLFLSYPTPDHRLAASLRTAILGAVPGADVFFDRQRLRVGAFWAYALT